MKRWIFSLLLLLGTITSGWTAGLIVVDEAHWKHQLPPDGIVPPPWPLPRPRPEPWPRPWPVPPPRIYQFCPLEVAKHQASVRIDRKSTRLNSSHLVISYAVFCLKKKKDKRKPATPVCLARPYIGRTSARSDRA